MDREKSNINLRDINNEGERVTDATKHPVYGAAEPIAAGGTIGTSRNVSGDTDLGATTETTGRPRSEHGTTYNQNASSSEIKSDIDRTRSEMDQTLNELGEKLHPRNLFDELVGLFRKSNGNAMSSTSHEITQTLQSVGSSVLRQIKENPGPALLMGMGVCWFLFEESAPERPRRRRRRSSSSYASHISPEERSLVDARTGQLYDDEEEYVEPRERGYMISETSTYYPPNPAYPTHSGEASAETTSQTGESITDKASHIASQAGEAISDAASGAADVAGNVAHKAGEAAHTAYEKAGEWAHLAKQGARATGRETGRIARSTGHVVNQYGHQLGDYSYTLAQQAQILGGQVRRQAAHGYYYSRDLFNDAMNTSMLGLGAAFIGVGLVTGLLLPRTRKEDEWMGETSDTVKEKAMETGEELLEQGLHVAGQTVKTVTAEAKAQGLTPDKISEKLEHVVSRIQNAAYAAAQEEGLDVESLRNKAGQVAQRVTEKVKEETQTATEDVQQSVGYSGSGEKSTGTSTVKSAGTTGSKPSGSSSQSSGTKKT